MKDEKEESATSDGTKLPLPDKTKPSDAETVVQPTMVRPFDPIFNPLYGDDEFDF